MSSVSAIQPSRSQPSSDILTPTAPKSPSSDLIDPAFWNSLDSSFVSEIYYKTPRQSYDELIRLSTSQDHYPFEIREITSEFQWEPLPEFAFNTPNQGIIPFRDRTGDPASPSLSDSSPISKKRKVKSISSPTLTETGDPDSPSLSDSNSISKNRIVKPISSPTLIELQVKDYFRIAVKANRWSTFFEERTSLASKITTDYVQWSNENNVSLTLFFSRFKAVLDAAMPYLETIYSIPNLKIQKMTTKQCLVRIKFYGEFLDRKNYAFIRCVARYINQCLAEDKFTFNEPMSMSDLTEDFRDWRKQRHFSKKTDGFEENFLRFLPGVKVFEGQVTIPSKEYCCDVFYSMKAIMRKKFCDTLNETYPDS